MKLTCIAFVFLMSVNLIWGQDLSYLKYMTDDDTKDLQVCGQAVNEALVLICHGAYNGINKSGVLSFSEAKIFENAVRDRVALAEKKGFVPEGNIEDILSRNLYHPRFRRSITHECCIQTCTFKQLRRYCY